MVIWRKHDINRAAANLNSHLFKKKLVVETLTELADIASIFKKYNLIVEGITQV